MPFSILRVARDGEQVGEDALCGLAPASPAPAERDRSQGVGKERDAEGADFGSAPNLSLKPIRRYGWMALSIS